MRGYLITLAILAVLVGSLWQATEKTGYRRMNEYAAYGIFLFGVVGTLAINRWQSRNGVKETEAALKSLEPDAIITDWAFQGGGKPDYLVVGPGGLVAICVEDVAQTTRSGRASGKISKSRERVQSAVRWLRDRLNDAAPELKAPLGDLVQEVPVAAVLVLTRHQAEEEHNANGVAVVNADQLASHIRRLWERDLLDQPTRVRLTRIFRQG